jgi:DNA sulfur modification protein DndD
MQILERSLQMQLEKLTLTDVGTFGGRQEIVLTPKVRYGTKRPVVLFGGLNGTGKTTLLTAVRLALYGRQAVDYGTTQKQYDGFLSDLIHRPVNALVRSTSASISLEFTHAKMGERILYRVSRTWTLQGQGVAENLRVFQNNEEDEILHGEQAQAFLNQLIPPGISQFFFFDGEKIASLARDDSDAVLADAIKRLLGLDIAGRLDSDLSVFLRAQEAKDADRQSREEISRLEVQLSANEDEVKAEISKLEFELTPSLDKAKQDYERKHTDLMDRGGAWAVDRQTLEDQLQELRTGRRAHESLLRDQLSGLAIFTLAPKLSAEVVNGLKNTQITAEKRLLARAIKAQASVLKARLSTLDKLKGSQRLVGACIDEWVAELTSEAKGISPEAEYGFSDSDARDAIAALSISAPVAQRDLAITYESAKKMERDEFSIQEKLAHAPSEDTIKDAFVEITVLAKEVAKREVARKLQIEEIRRKTWISIEITRKLKKLTAAVDNKGRATNKEEIVESLQEMIFEFKAESAKEKCKTLEHYFVSAFQRLARKEDIVCSARINSDDFSITLLDRSGTEIPKKRLSAGEKQIYAVAMLEALAKASGRSLPIIIDTPLGRLDSKHRQKLVESYFPVASHQVIVLSTDTEVDLPFYQGLQSHISHGFHLAFDGANGITTVEEGYFWKNFSEEVRSRAA